MTDNSIRFIQITSLAKEEPFFIKLKIFFESGEIKHIKFRLDKFTYLYLRRVVFPSYINNKISNAICSIPVLPQYKNSQSAVEWIVWDILGQTKKLSFLCSNEYRFFINKIRSIGGVEEFNRIFSPIDKKKTDEAINKAIDEAPKPLPRTQFKYIYTTLVFAFCVFAASSTNLFGYVSNTVITDKDNKIVMAEAESLHPKQLIAGSIEQVEEQEKKNPEEPAEVPVLKEIIQSLPEGQVALTFDDGPSLYTQDILQVLEEHNVKATFFFIGKNIDRYSEAVMAVRDQGHGIGLHSFSHKVMKDLSLDKQEQEIEACLEVIKPYVDKVFLFRPPYGMFNDDTKQILSKHHMSLVLWNRDPRDWQVSSAEEILNKVLSTTYSGGIYLLHENALTLEALPWIIEALQKDGLKFVNLGDKQSSNRQVEF